MTLTTPNGGSAGGGTGWTARTEPPVVPGYTLLRVIGRGSYGEVWLAKNILGTCYALKVVYRGSFDRERPYELEFAGISKFEKISRSHESQMGILQVGRNDADGYFYYVMDLADAAPLPDVEGGGLKIEDGRQIMAGDSARLSPASTLSGTSAILHSQAPTFDPSSYVPRTLQHELDSRGRLPFAECLRISLALANALKHLHGHGLVHRDVKPSNIIFVNGVPKLADIGLVTDSEATMSYVGSQGFMPPEGPGRPKGDVYSLGKVIYEMCAGQDRLQFPAVPDGFVDWPDRDRVRELLTVALRACEPDPAKRYGSVEKLLSELALIQAGTSVRRIRVLERGWRWAKVALVLAVVGGGAAWFIAKSWTWQRFATRERLLREAATSRESEHEQGWRNQAMVKLREAGGIHLDDYVRAQAVAAFGGLDAKVEKLPTNCYADHLAFDRDGRRLLMDGGEGGRDAKMWDLEKKAFVEFTNSGRGPVWFARDGSPCLLRTSRSTIYQTIRLQDGVLLSEFDLAGPIYNTNLLITVAVSPDGTHAAAASTQRTIVHDAGRAATPHFGVWRTETGEVLKRGEERWTAFAFSPDNSCLAMGTADGRVQVRLVPDWALIASFESDIATVDCLAFAQDPGQPFTGGAKYPWLLAAGDSGGTIWIHRLSPPGVKSICRGSHYNVYAATFLPDGMTLVTAGREKVMFWDVATGRLLLNHTGPDYVMALAATPDGTRLAEGFQRMGGVDRPQVTIVDLEPGSGVQNLRGLASQSGQVTFSRDGEWLAALAHNWEMGIWNLKSNRLEHVLQTPQGVYADNASIAFSQDGSLVAFATSGQAKLWDRSTCRELRSWLLPRGFGQLLRFSPSGDASKDLLLLQWESDRGACTLRRLASDGTEEVLNKSFPFEGRLGDGDVTELGDLMVYCGEKMRGNHGTNVLCFWRTLDGREPEMWPHATGGMDFALDPTGTRMARMSSVGLNFELVEIPSGRVLATVPPVGAVSPGGEWLADARRNSGIPIWRLTSPKRFLTLGAGLRGPLGPRFSPDGHSIAWGISDGTVLVAKMDDLARKVEQFKLGW
jgi:WD40 repeat protein